MSELSQLILTSTKLGLLLNISHLYCRIRCIIV